MPTRRWTKLVLILAASVLPHLWGLASPPLDYHYHRQANTAAIARNYHSRGLYPWDPRIDWNGADERRAATELPLYMWLVGLLWPAFGLGDIWGRLLSTAASALTALAIWRFLEEGGFLDGEAAAWGAAAFGVLPIEVYFGRTIQPEALALLCLVLALWAWDRFLRRDGPPALWWGLSALSAVVAVGSKLPYAYLFGVMAALAWVRRGPKAARDPASWALAPCALLAVFAWYRWASSGVYVVPTTQAAYLHLLDYDRRMPYFAFYHLFSRFPELTTTYPGLLFFGAGAWALRREGRLWFPAAWWLCVYFDNLVGGSYAFHHEYIALSFAPVNAAFLGAGIAALRRRAWAAGPSGPTPATAGSGTVPAAARAPLWAKPALALLLLAMPVHAALRIKHWYKLNFQFVLDLKPVVDRLSAKEDLFLCNQRASSVYLYFIGRRGWSWDLSEVGAGRLGMVDEAVAGGAKFFLTAKEGIFLDRSDPIAGRFFHDYPIVYDGGGALIFRLAK